MENKEFNLEHMGLDYKLEPYNYVKYKAINPKLSIRMYERMREGGCLYKIGLGRKHVVKFPFYEVLMPRWVTLKSY